MLGDGVTIGGTTYVVSTIASPGVIRHTGATAKIICGRLDRRPDPILADYVAQMKAAKIDATLSDHMLVDLWKKFIVLTGTSGITASTRQPLGVVRDDDDMRALFYKLMYGNHRRGPCRRRGASVRPFRRYRPFRCCVSADHASLDGE